MVTIRLSPGAAMTSGSSAAASAAAANVAPAAITGRAVRGRRVAQNGLRRVAAGVEWLLNIRLLPSICVRDAPKRRVVWVGMRQGISRLSNSRHCYPRGETFGAVVKTNQVMVHSSGPLGINAVTG